MKKYFLLALCGVFSVVGMAQEFSDQTDVQIPLEIDSFHFFLPKNPKSTPSLTILVPEKFPYRLELTEVNYYKVRKHKGVDFVAMMEQEKAYKERIARATIEFPSLSGDKESIFTVSNNVHLYNRGSNYDYYTGKIKNPAYQEMRAGLFNAIYAPYNFSGQYRPYTFSPYLYSPSLR